MRDVTKNAMTVEDLIAELEQMDPKAKVLFTCDYGDIGHTKQVLAVENVDEYDQTEIHETGYSQSGWALRDQEDDTKPEDSGVAVVVIS